MPSFSRTASVVKKQLSYSDMLVERSCLVLRHLFKSHGSQDAKAVYKAIREIRTMLETDVVLPTAREFLGE